MLCICIQWRNKKLITHNYNSLNFFIYPNFSVPLSSFLAGQRRRVHQFASLHCLWLPFHGNLMKRWKERCLEKLRGDIIEKNLKNKSCLSLWIDPKYIITMRQKLCNWTKILQIFFLSVLTASEWAKFLLTCVRWPSSYCLIHFLKTLLWWFLDRFIFMFIWYG